MWHSSIHLLGWQEKVFWDNKPNIAHWSEKKIPWAAFLLLCFPVSCQERSRSLELAWESERMGPNRPCRAGSWRLHKFRMREGFFIGGSRKLGLGSCEVCSAFPLSPWQTFCRPSNTENHRGNWNVLHGCNPPSSDLKINDMQFKDGFQINVPIKINIYQLIVCWWKLALKADWVSNIPQLTFIGMHSQDAAWCFCHRVGKMKKHLTCEKEIKQKKPPSIHTKLESVSQNQAVQRGAERELCHCQSWEWENPWEKRQHWTPAELGCRRRKFKLCLLWQSNFKYIFLSDYDLVKKTLKTEINASFVKW